MQLSSSTKNFSTFFWFCHEGNRINELRFTAIDAVAVEGDTPEAIAADLAALPGQKNAWFGPLDEGTPLIRYNPEWPLALGSTFKLYILAALAEDVKAGRVRPAREFIEEMRRRTYEER